MTAITPLQSIHKKGIFGDHHQQNESDLLNVSELKNLSIIQIAQYKNSKIQLNNIEIDGLKIPQHNLKVSSNKDSRILWSAPNIWLVISKKNNILESIKQVCDDENFAITDVSHSRAVMDLTL